MSVAPPRTDVEAAGHDHVLIAVDDGVEAVGGTAKLPFHNLCISNVPGPPFPLYFLGAKLELFSVVAPVTDGFTLLFAVTSYDGKLVVTITSVPEIVPDPAFLAQCLRESFEEMKRAARQTMSRRPAAATRSPRRRGRAASPAR